MATKKKNCWEFMKCGREPGGKSVKDDGICPSSTFKKLNGFHGGKNGGRICWLVAGASCKRNQSGAYAEKIGDCNQCLFFQKVKKEENEEFFNSMQSATNGTVKS